MPRLRVGIVHDFTQHRVSVTMHNAIPRAAHTGKRQFVTPKVGTAMRRSHIRPGDMVSAHKAPAIKVITNKGGEIFGQRKTKRRTISTQYANQRSSGISRTKLRYQGGR